MAVMKGATVAYWPGLLKLRTTIVLSAPGRHEVCAGHPAAKQTGRNLQRALPILCSRRPDIFPSENLFDYRIVNASEIPEYDAATGRSEASDPEIRDPANIKRFRRQVKGSQFLVLLGDKGLLVARASGVGGIWLTASHPSLRVLNRGKAYRLPRNGDGMTPREKADARIAIWAEILLASIGFEQPEDGEGSSSGLALPA